MDLWVDYGQFAIEKAPVVESQFEFPRKVFEGAIVMPRWAEPRGIQ